MLRRAIDRRVIVDAYSRSLSPHTGSRATSWPASPSESAESSGRGPLVPTRPDLFPLFHACGAGGFLAPTLRRGGLHFFTFLLCHTGSIPGLRVLNPGRLVSLAGVLAGGAAGRPVPGAGLLPHFSGRNVLFACIIGRLHRLARRFGKLRVAFPAEVLEHLPNDGGGKLEVQGEGLRG